MNEQYAVKTEAQLEAIIGAPMDVSAKIATQLDDCMEAFIRESPLLMMATVDENGLVDISPKGDPCGFVVIEDSRHLLIPDRPGNRLTMGFRNVLRNPSIGLLFMAPNQRESLRVKGVATLTQEPALLERLAVNKKPALLCTRVEIQECFMHCGKALVRSKLWQPSEWRQPSESLGARQLAPVLGGDSGEEGVQKSRDILEKAYQDELY